ncbi:MAG: hypothetical protein GX196_03775 [Clostridiaceae bacterium]|nr:hypothetical protein [Clostridiaceae bacterium]
MIFLGIDTSCYTTSLAAFDGGKMISKRKLLEVKKGQKGLRQSDALFLHIKNLPDLYEELAREIDTKKIGAVGVSFAPRRVEGSYMPVFLAGTTFAKAIATTLNVPVFYFSHQEGHIAASLYSIDKLDLPRPFVAVHLSGGTTEIIRVKNGYECEIIGKTLDISAGSLIDRIGVQAGLPFPCGAHMERLVSQNHIKPPVSVKGGDINFSGAETYFKKVLNDENMGEVFHGVFLCVAKSLKKALLNVAADEEKIVFAGGVASNSIIKKYLIDTFGGRALFSLPEYATDNACGTAYLAYSEYFKSNMKE